MHMCSRIKFLPNALSNNHTCIDTKNGNQLLQDWTTIFEPTYVLHNNQHDVTSRASSGASSTSIVCFVTTFKMEDNRRQVRLNNSLHVNQRVSGAVREYMKGPTKHSCQQRLYVCLVSWEWKGVLLRKSLSWEDAFKPGRCQSTSASCSWA
jgi:hypothetical protein